MQKANFYLAVERGLEHDDEQKWKTILDLIKNIKYESIKDFHTVQFEEGLFTIKYTDKNGYKVAVEIKTPLPKTGHKIKINKVNRKKEILESIIVDNPTRIDIENTTKDMDLMVSPRDQYVDFIEEITVGHFFVEIKFSKELDWTAFMEDTADDVDSWVDGLVDDFDFKKRVFSIWPA